MPLHVTYYHRVLDLCFFRLNVCPKHSDGMLSSCASTKLNLERESITQITFLYCTVIWTSLLDFYAKRELFGDSILHKHPNFNLMKF